MKLYDIPQIDAKMYLRDETDLWGFLQNGEYEPAETELVKKLVKSNDVCLDIGANIGYYTILMAKLGRYVCTFEPEPSNFELLSKNVVLNDLSNIWYCNKAVDAYSLNNRTLHLCSESHGMHRMFESKFCNTSTKTDCISIDDFLKTIILEKIDFVKMDVEGYEYQVLKGMYNTIQKHHPKMLIEFHPPTLQEGGTNPQDVYESLKKLAYEIYLVPDIDNPISYDDLYKQTNNESGGQNILAMPK